MHSESRATVSLLRELWSHINKRHRRQLMLLCLFIVLTSIAEIFSISAILPFLAVLTNPKQVFNYEFFQPFIQFLHLRTPEELLLPMTVIFCIAVAVSGGMRLILLWANTRLAYSIGSDLGFDIYYRTLYQSYVVHISRNSSELIDGITSKLNSIILGVILPGLSLVSSVFILCVILVTLICLDPKVALFVFGGFGLIYGLMISLTRHRLWSNSQKIAQESTNVLKNLQESFRGIRDIIIDGSQAAYCENYRRADRALRLAQGSNSFISNSPRYNVEALSMIFIAVIAYVLVQRPNGVHEVLPILGTMAIGAQRLLPLLQQVYGAWTTIQGGQVSLQHILALLKQVLPESFDKPIKHSIPFQNAIRLNNVSFRYGLNMPWSLRHINLIIPKSSRIGIIGTTGSGKSTLLDIVMGLLQPTEGTLEIDDCPITPKNYRSWQSYIAHVPQNIYLSDSTIEENIAFGVPIDKIDRVRVRIAAEKAQLARLIENCPQKYLTMVGEGGVRLSGGQRQRIAIARAFYKNAKVIVFDEATSALDNKTEQCVMQTIEELSKDVTILIIAHRLTTLKGCTQIVELNEGKIASVCNYQDIALPST